MKVIKNILLVLFICVLGVFIFSSVKVYMLYSNNKKLDTEIKDLTKNKEKVSKDSETKETELNTLKEEAKDKIEEKEIWQKAEEKLKKALS